MARRARISPQRQTPLTAGGASFTSLVLEVFRLNGRFIAAGNALGRDLDLTSARWQVLGAIALEGRALTVAEIARAMGLTRQGVQRVVDDLEEAGMVARNDHPTHRRARLVDLTAQGRSRYAAIMRRQAGWANKWAERMTPRDLEGFVRGLRRLREDLTEPGRAARGRTQRKEE